MLSGGLPGGDKDWIRTQLKSFVVQVPNKKKPKFEYRLPIVGKCCKKAWMLAVGFPSGKNTRVATIAGQIRDPSKATSSVASDTFRRYTQKKVITRTQYAESFLCEYILTHSQRSPSGTDMYVN